MKITLKRVKELLENYQSHKSMVLGMQKLNQEELSNSLKEDIIVQTHQLKLLDNSILLLTDAEQEFVNQIYKSKISVVKYARDNYISRPKVYRMKEEILKKVQFYMEKLKV